MIAAEYALPEEIADHDDKPIWKGPCVVVICTGDDLFTTVLSPNWPEAPLPHDQSVLLDLIPYEELSVPAATEVHEDVPT